MTYEFNYPKTRARRPTGCEVLWLFVVNRRLGIEEYQIKTWDTL